MRKLSKSSGSAPSGKSRSQADIRHPIVFVRALVSMDRTASLEMGRPLSIFDEEYDTASQLDTSCADFGVFSIDAPLPRDCDDEYWITGPRHNVYFAQPADKPTVTSGFIQLLKLRRIQAYAMRTIVSVPTFENETTKYPRGSSQ